MTIENRKSSAAVTWRSVLIGLIGVLLICGLSPYNDFVVNNTFIVGNFMPVGLLLFFVMIVIVINAPLLRWRAKWALSARELTVAMAMALVSCGLPGAGLMRYLPPQLVGVWYWSGGSGANPDHTRMMTDLHLPDWLFPDMGSADTADRARSTVVLNYYDRIPGNAITFTGRFAAVPWAAWMKPAVAWSIFTAALFGAILFLMLIVRRQWVENERLLFPLAGIYAAVLEPPAPGRAFNSLFRNRLFWVSFGAIFLVHTCNALRQYFPLYFPEIPVHYNLSSIFSNEPWVYLEGDFKIATVYFCVVGICYFLPSQISLSVWLFYVIYQINVMIAGSYREEFTIPMKSDQFFGALLPYALALVWIGRQHWVVVMRQMFRAPRPDESQGRYLPYSVAGWGLVGCFSIATAFLCVAGASMVGAVSCIAMVLTLHLCVARIVAETGMPFVNFNGNLDRPWNALINAQGNGLRTTTRSFFLTQMISSIYSSDIRESTAVFTSHAYKLADDVYEHHGPTSKWRRTLPFTICIVLALVIGYVTAGVSKLYCEYTYAVTQDESQNAPMDSYGTDGNVRGSTLTRSYNYSTPTGVRESHNRLKHVAIGAGVSLALSIARLKSVEFPLHPVGFLLCYSWPVSKIWFSMFIGWLCKMLVVKFGGTDLYRRGRELFIGLILGEAGAAAFWLVVSLAMNTMGQPYKSIFVLPN